MHLPTQTNRYPLIIVFQKCENDDKNTCKYLQIYGIWPVTQKMVFKKWYSCLDFCHTSDM